MTQRTRMGGRLIYVLPDEEEGFCWESFISKTPGVCGGDACVRDTRITVWTLEACRRLGWDDAKLLEAYPQLTREDLVAAGEYARRFADEIERAIRENEQA